MKVYERRKLYRVQADLQQASRTLKLLVDDERFHCTDLREIQAAIYQAERMVIDRLATE